MRCGDRSGVGGRRSALIALVLAIAVPGLLVTACGGQPRAAKLAASEAGTARPEGQSNPMAMQLLTDAAQAAVRSSYQGEEVISRTSTGTATVMVADVWHTSRGQTLTQTVAAGTYAASEPYMSSDSDAQMPEGVLGVTTAMVRLLETHYVVLFAGSSSADNRTAQVVEARRGNGTLAARFWLDETTKLPLEREIFDPTAHLIGDDQFVNVSFTGTGTSPPTAVPPGSAADPTGPATSPLQVAQLVALRTRAGSSRRPCPAGCRCSLAGRP